MYLETSAGSGFHIISIKLARNLRDIIRSTKPAVAAMPGSIRWLGPIR